MFFLDFSVFAVADGKILGFPNILLSVSFDNAADYLGKQRVRKNMEFQKKCQGPTYEMGHETGDAIPGQSFIF